MRRRESEVERLRRLVAELREEVLYWADETARCADEDYGPDVYGPFPRPKYVRPPAPGTWERLLHDSAKRLAQQQLEQAEKNSLVLAALLSGKRLHSPNNGARK